MIYVLARSLLYIVGSFIAFRVGVNSIGFMMLTGIATAVSKEFDKVYSDFILIFYAIAIAWIVYDLYTGRIVSNTGKNTIFTKLKRKFNSNKK